MNSSYNNMYTWTVYIYVYMLLYELFMCTYVIVWTVYMFVYEYHVEKYESVIYLELFYLNIHDGP
jgi:hypothetical protein